MIYFDNSATSFFKPKSVYEAMLFAMKSFGNPSRGLSNASLIADRALFDLRMKIKDFFGSKDPRRVIFTKNSTEALNVVIYGFFNAGDHVITSVTEHNSVLRPLYKLKKEIGLDIDFIDIDDKGNLLYSEISKLIRSSTRAIVINHASNVTGNIADLYEISSICRKHDIKLIVDASQSAGHTAINMTDIGIDALCFTGHKALFGPQGIGAIVLNDDIEIHPLLVGGSGIHSFDEEQPKNYPTCLEAGTQNSHGAYALLKGMEFIEAEGLDNIIEHERKLEKRLYSGLSKMDGIRFFGDYDAERRCPIVSFKLFDEDSSKISMILSEKYDIASRPGAHCAPLIHKAFGTVESGMVRLSLSYFNTMEEVDFAINALSELSHSLKH